MKNENTITEAERIAKAFNQLANAIGNLCKAIRKAEVVRIPKTAPLPNPKPFYGKPIDWLADIDIKELYKRFHEKNNYEPNDPLAGMHVDEKKFPTSAACMARTMDSDWKKKFDKHFENLEKEINAKNYPDYICIKDYAQMKVGDIIKYQYIENYNKYVYAFIDKQNMIINCTKEDLEKSTEHFKKVETVETFNENKRFNDYICVKDFRDLKRGDVLKFDRADELLQEYIFTCHQDNDGFVLMNIDMIQKNPSHFVEYNKTVEPEYAFKMQKNDGYYANQKLVDKDYIVPATMEVNKVLKENQIITFTLKNGKTYKAQVLKDSTTKMYYLNAMLGSNAIYFMELNQMDYKNNLNKLYGNNDVYPSAPSLECLTNDLNTLIQLPDLSNKKTPLADLQKEVEIEKKCEELIEKFMPLVTKWKFEGNTIVNQEEAYSGVWSYSDNNKRKAAIKIAILHCELLLCKIIIEPHFINTNTVKNKLEKMLES